MVLNTACSFPPPPPFPIQFPLGSRRVIHNFMTLPSQGIANLKILYPTSRPLLLCIYSTDDGSRVQPAKGLR